MHQMKYIQFKFYIREGNKGSSYLSLSYCCFLSVKCCRPHQTIEHTNSNILGQKRKRRGKRKEKKKKNLLNNLASRETPSPRAATCRYRIHAQETMKKRKSVNHNKPSPTVEVYKAA